MIKHACFVLSLAAIIYCCGCNDQQSAAPAEQRDSNYVWARLTDNAAYPKSYNFQLLDIRDTLWVLHSEGAWFSVNGKNWTKSSLTNIIRNNGFLDYVWFNGALYGLGTFDGNIEHYTLTSAINRTTDMQHWEQLAAQSELPRRFFYHPFVFNNRIWIIGGSNGNEEFADAWSSADAVHWKKEADNLPFDKRRESQFVFFHNKIFLLNNDAWSSDDAIHWTKEADRFVPEEIFGYAPIVFDDKIWLLGCNRNNIFKSEALVSSDGRTWATESAPWSPRGGATACLYKGKIYFTGGKYGGLPDHPDFRYSNDVWTMEKKQ